MPGGSGASVAGLAGVIITGFSPGFGEALDEIRLVRADVVGDDERSAIGAFRNWAAGSAPRVSETPPRMITVERMRVIEWTTDEASSILGIRRR